MILHSLFEKIYSSALFARHDEKDTVKYFSYTDFEGLREKSYGFKSSHGHILKGHFYYYDGYRSDRLIIFEHGLGGGHRSYMKEIERICREGYLVFSYDHTGCAASEGENCGGFSQSLCDLDDAIKTLKEDSKVPTADISVIGHSWGGYSTLNISALHPDIKSIVVFSGPISVSALVAQFFSGILSIYRKDIMKLEYASNPEYVEYDAISTLKNASTKALLIYSANDGTVKKQFSYDPLYEAFRDSDRVQLILEENKGHNPNYTENAVAILSDMANKAKKLKPKTEEENKAFVDSFDWHAMTEQDEKVWAKVFEVLK